MAYALVILGISIPYIFSSYWYAQAMQALKDFKSQVAVTSRSWQVGQPFAIDRAFDESLYACAEIENSPLVLDTYQARCL